MHNRFYSYEEKARNRGLLYVTLAGLYVAAVVLKLTHVLG